MREAEAAPFQQHGRVVALSAGEHYVDMPPPPGPLQTDNRSEEWQRWSDRMGARGTGGRKVVGWRQRNTALARYCRCRQPARNPHAAEGRAVRVRSETDAAIPEISTAREGMKFAVCCRPAPIFECDRPQRRERRSAANSQSPARRRCSVTIQTQLRRRYFSQPFR